MLRSAAARSLLALVIAVSLLFSAAPASSITESEVDSACAESSAAKEVLDVAEQELLAATTAHQDAYWQRDDIAYKPR